MKNSNDRPEVSRPLNYPIRTQILPQKLRILAPRETRGPRRRPSTIDESDEEMEHPERRETLPRIPTGNRKPFPAKQTSVSGIDDIVRKPDDRRKSVPIPRASSLPRRPSQVAGRPVTVPSATTSITTKSSSSGARIYNEQREELLQELEGQLEFLNTELQDRDRRIAQLKGKLRQIDEKQSGRNVKEQQLKEEIRRITDELMDCRKHGQAMELKMASEKALVDKA
ncbi:unnamed protein product, partial [Mesorhabditis spiculigera]